MSLFSEGHKLLLDSLIRHGVDFTLIGGHAAVYYGVRRTTSDIDILVLPTLENGCKILAAFKDLNLDVTEVSASDFTTENVFTFGSEPEAVDLLTYTKGLQTETIFQNALLAKIDGMDVRIIDVRDLLKNKESLNRKGEKGLVVKQDILALRRILKERK